MRDPTGVTLADAMSGARAGSAAPRRGAVGSRDRSAFVELHIEQGNLLETAGLPIGVVDGIAAAHDLRLILRVEGTARTPAAPRCTFAATRSRPPPNAYWPARRSPATPASRHAGDGWPARGPARLGHHHSRRGAVSVDVRDLDSARQRETARDLISRFAAIAERRGVKLVAERIGDTSPAILPSPGLAAEVGCG